MQTLSRLNRIGWLLLVVGLAACAPDQPLPTLMVLPSPSATNIASPTPEAEIAVQPTIPTASPTTTDTPTQTPSVTNTDAPTQTPSATITDTPTSAPTSTPTATVPPQIAPDTSASTGAGATIASIDLMVIYTTQVRDANGGDAVVQNIIAQSVAAANRAYIFSGVHARLNLIHTQAITYTDEGSLQTALDWVSKDAGVAALRDTYRADIVTLVVENADKFGGLALPLMPSMANDPMQMASRAFNVVVYRGLPGELMAHEIGHSMGLQHNSTNATNTALFADAYGYQDPEGRFLDIMAYGYDCPQPCPSVPYFSNPDMYFGSIPMGSSTANAVRVLNYTAPYVAQFRAGTPPQVTVSPTPTLPAMTATATPSPAPAEMPPACTTTADDAASLADAMTAANADAATTDVICLASIVHYEVSTSDSPNAFPTITTPLVIMGNGALIARTGTADFRFFTIVPSGTLTLYDLTLKNGGLADNGGTISNNGGSLTLHRVVIIESLSATYGMGGGIYHAAGTTRIFNSRFEANSATYGGAIGVMRGTVEITSSVFFTNVGAFASVLYASDTATVSIRASCLVHNAGTTLLANSESNPIDAMNNWWGRSSGPAYANAVLATGADIVGDNVIASPYQLHPMAFCSSD